MYSRTWSLLSEILPKIHWDRRLELLAVVHFLFLWLLLPILSIWIPFYLLFTRFWVLVPLYALWTVYNWRAPREGSFGGWKWYKNHSVWRYFANYFPIRLVKTAELPPDRNYIIGSHPHGVLSIGAFTHMVTNGTGFRELFPCLETTILTLNGQFYFPFRRDVGLALGGVESSKESLSYLLQNPGKGRAVGIVIGGVTEMLDSKTGSHSAKILNRRGFCRYAIMHGADLVPMYNFGENDVYEQAPNPHGSALRAIQSRVKHAVGFCPPLFHGSGLVNRVRGLLPFRKPITSVMGKPIRVQQNLTPSSREINDLHAQYCASLVALFEDHKHVHKIPAHISLKLY